MRVANLVNILTFLTRFSRQIHCRLYTQIKKRSTLYSSNSSWKGTAEIVSILQKCSSGDAVGEKETATGATGEKVVSIAAKKIET